MTVKELRLTVTTADGLSPVLSLLGVYVFIRQMMISCKHGGVLYRQNDFVMQRYKPCPSQ